MTDQRPIEDVTATNLNEISDVVLVYQENQIPSWRLTVLSITYVNALWVLPQILQVTNHMTVCAADSSSLYLTQQSLRLSYTR